jgi:hypothetical protein
MKSPRRVQSVQGRDTFPEPERDPAGSRAAPKIHWDRNGAAVELRYKPEGDMWYSARRAGPREGSACSASLYRSGLGTHAGGGDSSAPARTACAFLSRGCACDPHPTPERAIGDSSSGREEEGIGAGRGCGAIDDDRACD